jgi:predicted Zn finger-like uncharacterized protein
MRLTCPSCAAIYEVPSNNLKVGRRAQCDRCGATWIPLRDEPPPELPAELPPGEEEPPHPTVGTSPPLAATAMDRLAAQAKPRPSIALRTAWAASILLLIGAATAGFVWRAGIVQAWPPSARLLGSPTGPALPPADAHPPAPHPGAGTANTAPQVAPDAPHQPTAQQPAPNQPTANQPTANQPTANQPTANQPTAH